MMCKVIYFDGCFLTEDLVADGLSRTRYDTIADLYLEVKGYFEG